MLQSRWWRASRLAIGQHDAAGQEQRGKLGWLQRNQAGANESMPLEVSLTPFGELWLGTVIEGTASM